MRILNEEKIKQQRYKVQRGLEVCTNEEFAGQERRGGPSEDDFLLHFRAVDPHFFCPPPLNLPRASSAEARSFSVNRLPPEGVDTPL
jgi:hypothetical protein